MSSLDFSQEPSSHEDSAPDPWLPANLESADALCTAFFNQDMLISLTERFHDNAGGGGNAYDVNKVHKINNVFSNTDIVSMDASDPLESYNWWDGETFYYDKKPEEKFLDSSLDNENCISVSVSSWKSPSDTTKTDVFKTGEDNLLNNPLFAQFSDSGESVFECLNFGDNSFTENIQLHASLRNVPPNGSQTTTKPCEILGLTSSTQCQNLSGWAYGNSHPKADNEKKVVQYSLSSSCPPSSTSSMLQHQFLSSWDANTTRNDFTQSNLLCNLDINKNSCSSSKEVVSSDLPYCTSEALPTPETSNIMPSIVHVSASAPVESVIHNWICQSGIRQNISRIPQKRNNSFSDNFFSFSSLSLTNDSEAHSHFDDSDHDEEEEEEDDDDMQSSDGESFTFEETYGKAVSPTWLSNLDWKHIGSQRKHCYFWQYNIQSKGPKGLKLSFSADQHDPHILSDTTDPVFSVEGQLEGIKHSGKARRGDGNDLTPNPYKLFSIGLELKKLSKVINDLTPVSDMPYTERPLSRKEKNKLASRACRLKKKAQHEANKIKLYGLQKEHKQLMKILTEAKEIIIKKMEQSISDEASHISCSEKLNSVLAFNGNIHIAGHTPEFVNSVLDKVAEGEPNGGLGKL